MKRSGLFLLVTLSGSLGGCAGIGLLDSLGLGQKAANLNQGAPFSTDIGSVTKVKIDGTVAVPALIANNANALNASSLNSSSLISNNANALVGNNANALVGNNANALVGNNANALTAASGLAPAFRVAGVDSRPVEKMFVAAFNESLKPVSGITLTDANGKFSLAVPPGVVLIEAVRGQARQLGLAYSDTKQVNLDLSTTLVAAQMQATGKFASYHKADVDNLVAEVAKSAGSADADALLGSDGDLKTRFNGLASAKTMFENILAGNSTSGSGSTTGGNNSGNNTGGNNTGGDTTGTRTYSTITVATWPEIAESGGNYVKKGEDGGLKWLEVNRQQGNPSLVFATHSSPNIKAGDVVMFNIKVTGSSLPQVKGKYPAYLKFLRSDGTPSAVIGLYYGSAPSDDALSACNGTANAASCTTAGGFFVPFKLTIGHDIAKLEFGGEASSYTSQIDQIVVNP